MGRPRLIGLLGGVAALLALLAPSSALAGTFSWTLPNDFTTTPPGANPEQKYGAMSWSYAASGGSLSFSSNADGSGHPGWHDSVGDSIADTGSGLSLNASASLMGGDSVTVSWTNPFPSSQTVTVTDTIKAGACLGVGSGVTQTPAGSSVTLAPGKSVSVTLSGGTGATSCTAAGGIQITASTPGPTVTLESPGAAPLHTATLQLTGTASTGFSDSNQVAVAIYSGTDTSSSPIRQLTSTVDAAGGFSVQVSPALADGQYTAVASQASSIGTGQSPAVTFRIKVAPPALTLDRPPGDVWIGRKNLVFSGRAGNELGDASRVTLSLYRGQSTGGSLVGNRDVSVQGSSWSTGWPGLNLGYYTVVATQSDDAGHTTRTTAHTFRLVSRTTAFGSGVTVAGDDASIPIGCLAASDQSCRGTVLIVTKGSYRTAPGAPSGPLEVLFANVRIPGGAMGVISGRVPGSVLGVLRRLRHVPVTVTSKLSNSGRKSASRVLRVS